MRPADEYNKSRLILMELLKQPDDIPVDVKLTDDEADFLRITTAFTVLLYHICFTANFNAADALKGVEALAGGQDMRKMVYAICNEEQPDASAH